MAASPSEIDDLVRRFGYHPPKDERVIALHTRIRDRHLALALGLIERLPVGRERSLALTALEESMYWANAAVARWLNYASDEELDVATHGLLTGSARVTS